MKPRHKRSFFNFIFFLFLCSLPGQQAWAWSIDQFDVNIEVAQDGRVTVEENITADFRGDPHHGIYRFIPLSYTTRFGHAYRLRTRLEEAGSAKPDDRHWTSSKNGQLYVKIGNPDRYHQERVSYRLQYSIANAIHHFDTHDELYWNATGNEWNTSMKKVRVTITLPEGVKESDLNAAAFLGAYGTRESSSVQIQKDRQKVIYEVTRPLAPYEGLTVVLGVGKGILQEPSVPTRMKWFFQDNWPYGICILMLVWLFFRWWTRGRDPSGRGTITVTYESPQGMTPAEVGTLIDEKADLRDITASLVDLAVRGYLTIEEEEDEDFIFRKSSSSRVSAGGGSASGGKGAALKSHEGLLLKAVFSSGDTQRLSSLKNKFYIHLKPLQKAIYRELVGGHYFDQSPDKKRLIYRIMGIFPVVIGLILFVVGINQPQMASWGLPPLPFLVSGLILGMLFMVFAPLMPRKTAQGVMAFEQIRGLEEYISRAEAETLQKVDVPALFEKLLPFAMCLGLTKSWVKAFEGLFTKPPDWYSSRYPGTWSAPYFSQSLGRMERSSSRVFTSIPRTSGAGSSGFGGGFSGGGSGGGGGGAW